MQDNDFTPPGPGRWALDRSHFPGGTTPISQWLMEECMAAGLGRAFAEVGVPADSVQARFVDGFMYTRLRPLLRPDAASTKLPPAVVLRVVTRVHPAFRRREKAAGAALRTRPWLEVASRWESDIKPALEAQNRRFQAVDTDALDDADLARHVGELLEHCRIHAEMHFWLHGHDLGPIARYLYTCQRWRIATADALPALAGASPSTSAPLRQLVRLRALVDAAGVVPSSLDDVRAVSPEAAALLDDYLAQRGQLIVTRYDIDGLTLNELPGTVLLSVLEARPPEEDDHEEVILALRARVPEGERALFDEVLGDARAVMDMRDDNGPLTYEWPAGLMRRALLSVGTRLVATGRLADAEHALELTPAEARVVMRTATPTASELAARAEERAYRARLTPPPVLGPDEPAPPLDVLPPNLAQMVAMVQLTLSQMGMLGERAVDPLSGAGIGTEAYQGRVRIATSPEQAIDTLEPGDVLVVRATSPAFNAVLSIAGAVVTAEGGPLSHAAVLARELGIPAVVGASGALDLHDGSLVEVDPRAGAVRVLTA
jgi:phosphohistidine swiveling domain-containing protein